MKKERILRGNMFSIGLRILCLSMSVLALSGCNVHKASFDCSNGQGMGCGSMIGVHKSIKDNSFVKDKDSSKALTQEPVCKSCQKYKQSNSEVISHAYSNPNLLQDNINSKEQFYSHCVLESDPSEESNESYQDVFDVLNMLSDPEIADPKLGNVERFQKIADSQRESGDSKLAESFKHMADQTQAVLDTLDNKELNSNGFEFDPSIFDAAKQDFNLNDYLSDEDNNPLSSFQKIMDTVSKQRNNDPSLDNIDLLQNLATDQLHDGDHEFGDLFAQLADQTSVVMKALGIDTNLDEDN